MSSVLFKQPPRAQILMKSKRFYSHQIENCVDIILGIEIGHSNLELRTIKVPIGHFF